MYERSEKDFYLSSDGERGFSVHIGTWCNSSQSLADCLFYLSLRSDDRRDSFLKELSRYENLFQDKDRIVRDIRKNKLNYNSVINTYSYNEFVSSMDDEQSVYYANEDVLISFIDSKTDEVIKIILDSEDIIEAYERLQELKEDLKDELYDNWFVYAQAEAVA